MLTLPIYLGFPECRYFHKAGFSFWKKRKPSGKDARAPGKPQTHNFYRYLNARIRINLLDHRLRPVYWFSPVYAIIIL
jgi:hypothetical protein